MTRDQSKKHMGIKKPTKYILQEGRQESGKQRKEGRREEGGREAGRHWGGGYRKSMTGLTASSTYEVVFLRAS